MNQNTKPKTVAARALKTACVPNGAGTQSSAYTFVKAAAKSNNPPK